VAENLPKDRPDFSERQERYQKVVPARDDVLLMLDEVQAMWEVSVYAVYKAVAEGKLRRVRRPGYQPYYAFSDVRAWLQREPKNPPPELMGG